jgi:DNA polymerase-3 subunit beta
MTDTTALDMLAMMSYLRDAPAIGVHVPGRPDINGATLQRGIRFMFDRVPLSLPPLEVIAAPAVKVKATRARKSAVAAGSAGQWVAAVRTVIRATHSGSGYGNIPILACIRITVQSGVATLSGTDMERAITYTLDAPSIADLDCVTNAKALLAALRAMPADTLVTLDKVPDSSRNIPAVAAGPYRPAVPARSEPIPGPLKVGRTSLATMALEDWPSLKLGEIKHRFGLPAESAITLFATTQHATSTEETRYYLNGTYVHVVDSRMRAVTTDGHRLALQWVPMPDHDAKDMPGVIIPRATVADLLAMLQPDARLSVELSAERVAFECGPVRLVSKLIDGTFPDYERVIPREEDCPHSVTLDRDSFTAAIKAASAILPKTGPRAVKLTACKVEGTVTASATNADDGSYAAESVQLPYGCSVDMVAGYQARYLLDVLGACKGSVQIHWHDSVTPCRILDTENPEAVFVLMPMRL